MEIPNGKPLFTTDKGDVYAVCKDTKTNCPLEYLVDAGGGQAYWWPSWMCKQED